MNNMKTCSKCNIEKTLDYFIKHKQTKDGLNPHCKSCRSKASKKWANKNKDILKSYYKQWRINNPNKFKESQYNWRYQVKGVYGIFEDGLCLYVGESKRLRDRLIDHKRWIKNPYVAPKTNTKLYLNLSQHTNYVMGILEQTDNHKEREQFYINKLKPMYNGK